MATKATRSASPAVKAASKPLVVTSENSAAEANANVPNVSKPQTSPESKGNSIIQAVIGSKAAHGEGTPAIFAYPHTRFVCSVGLGYSGARFVCVNLAEHGPSAWSVAWFVASVVSAMSVAFVGDMVYTFCVNRTLRGFMWQNRVAVACASLGCALAICLTQAFGREGDVFSHFDNLNFSLLVIWGTSKAFVDSAGKRPLVRFIIGLIGAYVFIHAGDILRDLVAIGFGKGVPIASVSMSVLVSCAVATLCSHLALRLSPVLQLGFMVPMNFLAFSLLPKYLCRS